MDVINYSKIENIKIIEFLKQNIDSKIIYDVCSALKDIILNLNYPEDTSIINGRESYNQKYINILINKVDILKNEVNNLSNQEIFDFIKVWYTQSATIEEIKKSIQPHNERFLLNPDLVDWEYIQNVMNL